MILVRWWFKGAHSYELQVGPFVFQVRHNDRDPIWDPVKRATVWRDTEWRHPANRWF